MYVCFSLSGDDSVCVCAEHGRVNCEGHAVTAMSTWKS